MKKLLFLCSRNKLRSPTAQDLFSELDGVETDSAGVSRDAEVFLSEEQIEWADLILVMEKVHRSKLNQKFGHCLGGKKVVVLNIPDNYEYMDEELVSLLERKCAPYL